MLHAVDDGVVFAPVEESGIGDDVDAVMPLHFLRIGPRIEDLYARGVFSEGVIHVGDLGVAHIGAVFLECETKDEDAGIDNRYAGQGHLPDELRDHIFCHRVVDASRLGGESRIDSLVL